MTDHMIAEMVREAIRRRRLTPPRERYEDLIRRGVINRAGKILLSMPLPPGTVLDEEDRFPEADPPVDSPVS